MDARNGRSRRGVGGPFGHLLRQARLAAALSQEELAARAGISVRGISDIERGIHQAPRPATVRLLADALGLEGSERASFAAAARPAAADTNAFDAQLPPIPNPRTRLVGRERELEAISALVGTEGARLVTLTGPGGSGKTRFAIAAARRIAGNFSDGVAFADLAPVADPGLVPTTIATALGLRNPAGLDPTHLLRTYLADKRLLLILDNVEHLVACAPVVAELLAAAPGVTVLATSRERLRLRGEHELPVPPLPVPDPLAEPEPAALLASDAVALFVERATAANPDFRFTAGNASVIAEICRRLDGLPLAIELAAARLRILPANALLARLERALPLLVDGPRDAPARQQTLRSAIAWSHDLLAPDEKTLFRRLAIFPGGVCFEAAVVVMGPGVDRADRADAWREGDRTTFDLVGSLVSKSLLWPTEGPPGKARFRMLETVREFAQEHLVASGDLPDSQRRLAEWCLDLVRDAEVVAVGPRQAAWLDELEAELANLSAALGWLIDIEADPRGLRLACDLHLFWLKRGRIGEGRTWLRRAMARVRDAPLAIQADALVADASLAIAQADYPAAAEAATAALQAFTALADQGGIARALHAMGAAAGYLGQIEEAIQVLEQARAAYDEAGTFLTYRALATAQLAQAHAGRGEWDRAQVLGEAALASLRAADEPWGVGLTLMLLATMAHHRGDVAAAATLYGQGMAAWSELGDRWGLAEAIAELAITAWAGDLDAPAARLAAAGETHLTRVGATIQSAFAALHDRMEADLRSRLGETRFAAEQAAGRDMALKDAIDFALTVVDALAAGSRRPEAAW